MPDRSTLHVRVNALIGSLRLETDVSLTSPWTVIFGSSGSGKSSLLRLIAGFWSPAGMEVTCGDEVLTTMPPHRRNIAIVAQQPALFPNLSVRKNIAFGTARNRPGSSGGEGDAWVGDLITNFGLAAHADAMPATLSGGERQRAAIARALASRPKYLLLDEVFTGMHQSQQDELIGKLRSYGERLGMGIVSVTHDIAEAFASATEVLKINNGRIVSQGSPASVLATEREALLHQLDSRNHLEGSAGAP